MTISDEQRLLNKAKVGIMTQPNTVFISTVLFGMKAVWVQKEQDPEFTAATDGLTLYLGVQFFKDCNADERIGLLLHETWHVCWNHMMRGVFLDHKKYNQAGDYVINIKLLDDGFKLPSPNLCDKKYRNMGTRAVYDVLPEPPDEPGGGGKGKGGMGSDIIYDDPNASTAQKKAKEIHIAGLILNAVTQSKLRGDDPGSIPAEISRNLDNLLSPKLKWNQILRNWVSGYAKDDFSYSRPNRRYMPEFYLPSEHSEVLKDVCGAVDASGSVSDEQFKSFVQEMKGIQEMLKPEKFTIMDFDTCIKAEHVLNEYQKVQDIKFKGGGGTDIRPVINWGIKNKPIVMIIFTDGYFDPYEPKEATFPIIWIINDNLNFTSKLGKIIHYDPPGETT